MLSWLETPPVLQGAFIVFRRASCGPIACVGVVVPRLPMSPSTRNLYGPSTTQTDLANTSATVYRGQAEVLGDATPSASGEKGDESNTHTHCRSGSDSF